MDNAQVLAVIPARYASTRFPGKPLVDIGGQTMIERVWRQVQKSAAINKIVIATDDTRIETAARQFGAEVMMTSAEHPSGTDRMWEVAGQYPEYGLVFNIQGDEPFLDPDTLTHAVTAMATNPDADIVTAVTPIQNTGELSNPNCVKAVLSEHNRVLYFSRGAVPHHRDEPDELKHNWRHLGLYLYRREALQRFTQLPPSQLETIERLEQLRALEAGMRFHAIVVEKAPVGVDTPEDLEKLKALL